MTKWFDKAQSLIQPLLDKAHTATDAGEVSFTCNPEDIQNAVKGSALIDQELEGRTSKVTESLIAIAEDPASQSGIVVISVDNLDSSDVDTRLEDGRLQVDLNSLAERVDSTRRKYI